MAMTTSNSIKVKPNDAGLMALGLDALDR
jgi:hypothetical protein